MDTQVVRKNIIKGLSEVILRMNNLDEFLRGITDMLVENFELAWATLSLLNEASGRYTLRASSRRENVSDTPLLKLDNAASWVRDRQRVLTGRLIDEFGTQMEPELRREITQDTTFASLPLFAGERLVGVINLSAKAQGAVFVKEELEILGELAELIGACVLQAVEQQNIVEQKKHNQNILDSLVSAIIAVDTEGKVTIFNRAAQRILKFKTEQVLGRDVKMLQANLSDLLLEALHQGKTVRRAELYILPENTLIGLSTSQFYDSKGKLLGACVVFSSLSDIKKKEEKLRQQDLDSYWSNVANSLAHEVKNSIVATKVYTEMFPKKYEDAEFRWSLYSTLKRDINKLDRFSEKVLNFAQAQKAVSQTCELDKVMEAAISSAIYERDVNKISFEKVYSPTLPALSGDYHQLKDAFEEIVVNALEAMDKQGTLKISIEEEESPEMLFYNLPQAISNLPKGGLIVIKISDTGKGISEEHLSRIFDPFFTTKEGRTGLGLASSRKIVERHNGVIEVKSSLNQGTTFYICLPLA